MAKLCEIFWRVEDRYEPDFEKSLDKVGRDDCPEVPAAAIAEAAELMEKMFGVQAEQESLICGDLLAALVEATGDPEVSAAEWVSKGTPLGISNIIPVHGVFPPVPPEKSGSRCSSGGR